MSRDPWWSIVHGVAKSWTGLSDFTYGRQVVNKGKNREIIGRDKDCG